MNTLTERVIGAAIEVHREAESLERSFDFLNLCAFVSPW